jgi:hypothetical protein
MKKTFFGFGAQCVALFLLAILVGCESNPPREGGGAGEVKVSLPIAKKVEEFGVSAAYKECPAGTRAVEVRMEANTAGGVDSLKGAGYNGSWSGRRVCAPIGSPPMQGSVVAKGKKGGKKK